jgi:hypothetical protein
LIVSKNKNKANVKKRLLLYHTESRPAPLKKRELIRAIIFKNNK